MLSNAKDFYSELTTIPKNKIIRIPKLYGSVR